MTEYSRMAKGHFTAGASQTAAIINLPFKPDFVEVWNYTNIKTSGASLVTRAWWDNSMTDPVTGNPSTMIEGYSAGTATIFDVILSNGISAFSNGLSLQYGPKQQVVSITKANPAVVTVTAHGLTSGDVVIFQGLSQTATTGMQQIAGIPFTVTVIDANSFSIPFNTNQSNFTALSGSPATAFMKKVLTPYLYAPGATYISNITLGATTTIDTTDAHNFVVGQEVAIRIPPAWGTIELNSLPNVQIPGSPMYGYVVAVTDYNTVVVNINSSSFTAFNSNQPFLSYPGEQFPQIVAVGDVNTGGVQISAGSVLYPPPYTVPIGTTRVNTINGPAIQGAFFNNTSQGFIIGAGAPSVITGTTIVTASSQIFWRAFLHDINVV